ncbi:MAG: antibiotic biosynthesis monooxygenase family protein [Methanospirillum sp.]
MTTTVGVGTPFTLAEWEVRPGDEAAFIEAWDRFAEWTAEHQPGAVVGALLQDATNSRRFVSYGPWERPEQIAPWRATPEFLESFARFRELCTAITPHTMTCVAIRGPSA